MKETCSNGDTAYLATIVAAVMGWAHGYVRHRHGPKHAAPGGTGLHVHVLVLWIRQLHEVGVGTFRALHWGHIKGKLHGRPGKRMPLPRALV